MPDWMTTDNLTLALVVLMTLERIIRALAPKTATTLDDKFIGGLDDARGWAADMAPHLWAVVETLAMSGAIPKAQKTALFALKIREAYQKATGKLLSDGAVITAETVAAGLSAADKLDRLPTVTEGGKPANPPAGPA
jgi:hypothetical protein